MVDPRSRIDQARRQVIGPPACAAVDGRVAQLPSPVETTVAGLPGKPHGRKRCVGVHLPAPARGWLTEQRQAGDRTIAEIVLDALRDGYPHLAARHAVAIPERNQGLIPPSRAPRLRRGLDEPRIVNLLLDADQARAVATIAAELGLTLSDLITKAIDQCRP